MKLWSHERFVRPVRATPLDRLRAECSFVEHCNMLERYVLQGSSLSLSAYTDSCGEWNAVRHVSKDCEIGAVRPLNWTSVQENEVSTGVCSDLDRTKDWVSGMVTRAPVNRCGESDLARFDEAVDVKLLDRLGLSILSSTEVLDDLRDEPSICSLRSGCAESHVS